MDKKTVKVIEKYSIPFVQLVLEKGEEDRIFSDLTQIKQVAEETGLPSPLTDEQKSRLLPLIEKKMSLKVRSVKEQIDESLIGGFVIFANHKTIDVSIKQQLKVVKENLK